MTNCIGSIPGFVAPRIASEIVKADNGDISNWRIVWIITITILIIESITFIIFAEGKPQKWNAPPEGNVKEGKKDLFLVFSKHSRKSYSFFLFQIFFTVGIALVGVIYAGTMMAWNSIHG